MQLNCKIGHNVRFFACDCIMKSTQLRHAAAEPDPATALLLANGVRATGARSQVLAVLLDSKRALSHLEVQSALPAMDRVTLYRALDCLTDAGIAIKYPATTGYFVTVLVTSRQVLVPRPDRNTRMDISSVPVAHACFASMMNNNLI